MGDDVLSIEHLQQGLGRRTARGGFVMVAAQGIRFGLGLLRTAILARLVTPAAFGLVSMVTVLTNLANLFVDMGLSSATIQRTSLTSDQVNVLFWLNVGVSLAAGVVLALVSPAVAWFYGEPALRYVTVALAAALVLSGLGVQHRALLSRQLRFKAIAVCDLSSLVVGAVAAIAAAWAGWEHWALVILTVSGSAAGTVAAWVACRWIPSRPAWTSGAGELVAFGTNVTTYSLANWVARNLDNALIGRYWGATPLGIYDRAYQLLTQPLSQICAPLGSVALPALSRLIADPAAYGRAYLRVLRGICMVTAPMVVFMLVCSDLLVATVLGPAWHAASSVFFILGLAALVQPVSSTTGWLFLSQGRTAELSRWGLVGSLLAGIAIVAGLPYGVRAVALSYAVVEILVRTPLAWWYVGRRGPVSGGDICRTVRPSLAVGAGIAVSLAALRVLVWPRPAGPGFLLSAMVLTVVLGLGLYRVMAHERAIMDELMGHLRGRGEHDGASRGGEGE